MGVKDPSRALAPQLCRFREEHRIHPVRRCRYVSTFLTRGELREAEDKGRLFEELSLFRVRTCDPPRRALIRGREAAAAPVVGCVLGDLGRKRSRAITPVNQETRTLD